MKPERAGWLATGRTVETTTLALGPIGADRKTARSEPRKRAARTGAEVGATIQA